MILKSRKQFKSSEDFRDNFITTLTPGVIKRTNFIQWKNIKEKQDLYRKFFPFFESLFQVNKNNFYQELSDCLSSSDNPLDIVNCAFELLGHTGKRYVSNEDLVNFETYKNNKWNNEKNDYFAKLLTDIGIQHIIKTKVADYFLGVQVGLETNRRKNVGGEAFKEIIASDLQSFIKNLNSSGYKIIYSEEEKIFYNDNITSKQVDFCLKSNQQKIGIEINFYTTSGSKPTEIKRSYGQINKELEKVNAILVWITDGVGYMDMKNSLKEARDIHKNIYNYSMFKKHFESDLKKLFHKK